MKCVIGKQRALRLDIWPVPTTVSVHSSSCSWTFSAFNWV